MAARVSQYYAQDNTSAGDFVYPEPNYPYLYAARSDAGYTVRLRQYITTFPV
jgi:hypothetical protein